MTHDHVNISCGARKMTRTARKRRQTQILTDDVENFLHTCVAVHSMMAAFKKDGT